MAVRLEPSPLLKANFLSITLLQILRMTVTQRHITGSIKSSISASFRPRGKESTYAFTAALTLYPLGRRHVIDGYEAPDNLKSKRIVGHISTCMHSILFVSVRWKQVCDHSIESSSITRWAGLLL